MKNAYELSLPKEFFLTKRDLSFAFLRASHDGQRVLLVEKKAPKKVYENLKVTFIDRAQDKQKRNSIAGKIRDVNFAPNGLHAVFLQQLLPDYVLAYAGADLRKVAKYKAWGMLPQEWQPLEAEERGRLRDAFSDGRIRKAIATTVWSRGVNFDGLSVLVRADGGASGVKNKQ
ncbi:MAG TPA: hypothetical protein PKC74_08385, partial [Turneriella sp.]|nr:hypothetical protein [Turneriella sp.]